ncbi:hypothetical protein JXA32_05510 [Candidatus Sumerlaeota bacterium]|nr:hypothetical protein [Candidatus Sumerlaeota bacterium]
MEKSALLQSTSCCMLVPHEESDKRAMLDRALNIVSTSAQFGCPLPLPLVLDSCVATMLPIIGYYSLPAHDLSEAYSGWLEGVTGNLCGLQTAIGRKSSQDARNHDVCASLLPVLMRAWMQLQSPLMAVVDMDEYADMAVNIRSSLADINEASRNWGAQKTTSSHWDWFIKAAQPGVEAGALATDAYEAAYGDGNFLERLDYAAIGVFLKASAASENVPYYDILLRARRATVCDPIVRTYEEYARWGQFSPFTLMLGEYGEWLLANGKDPRLNAPPESFPDPELVVEFCWASSYESTFIEQSDVMLEPDPNGAKIIASPASALPAVVLLLAHDLREMLCDRLQITCAFSRAIPAFYQVLEYEDDKWKGSNALCMPPVSLIRAIFSRPYALEWPDAEWSWSEARTREDALPVHWRCGIILRKDLERLKRAAAVSPDKQRYALPRNLHHLVVLETVDGKASLWSVLYNKRDSSVGCELQPASPTNSVGARGDLFSKLREEFLRLACSWTSQMLKSAGVSR